MLDPVFTTAVVFSSTMRNFSNRCLKIAVLPVVGECIEVARSFRKSGVREGSLFGGNYVI